ncbi:unnamed protein product [Blumeria hordei]|uniref:Beige protein homolog 1 n=1 Tax=Blumeria hordei TaxID=2867405 RepID=A0A383UUU7_BLUHO|nr:unnamed protein product [Blumeria hordei]
MFGSTRRQRSSTSASTPPEASQSTAELQILLELLTDALTAPPKSIYPSLGLLIAKSESVLHYLLASSNPPRSNDDFRRLSGFQILLDTLRTFSGFYHPIERTHEEKRQIFELIKIKLKILSQVFKDHNGNQRYFRQRIEQGGWATLAQTIASIGIAGNEPDLWREAQLFGKLLSFALDDWRIDELCQQVINLYCPRVDGNDSPMEISSLLCTEKDSDESFYMDHVERDLSEIVKDPVLLHQPDFVSTVIDFWKAISRTKAGINPVANIVIMTLYKISQVSTHNLKELHKTGILSTLLPLTFDIDSPLGSYEKINVEAFCKNLISVGINDLSDTEYLIQSKSSGAAEFLLEALDSSQTPPFIQFDLSLNGYASIELPNLGRCFPPPPNIPGYSLVVWMYVDRFDPKIHTTIFGAFDSSQTCFVLAYLEKDSHNFILQTSVTSPKPSVRFKSIVFREKKWYHVAIVHRRHRTMTASKVSLYVDGEFVEQVKCQYPTPPPLSNASTESFASFSSSARANPVQVFLGTPKDLSAHVGPNEVFSRWSFASAHLLEDALSNDLIAVYYRLGPRYQGNFQDCLGSFQTYEASAALGMRNELIHSGKDSNSEIICAIREKASTLLPESRILLSLLPISALPDDERLGYHQSQIYCRLEKVPSRNLIQLSQNNTTKVLINAAVPSINRALTRPNGTAVLTGNPVIIIPQSLDNSLWQIGGFTSIVLKLVENSTSQDEILRAVGILFHGIKDNWRNSEAMERENGYAILAALLRGKIGAGTVILPKTGLKPRVLTHKERENLSFRLFSLILNFIGYNHANPEESYIINPLAYRILLVDFDMWRKTATDTQVFYYKQFITFGVSSKFHQFNSRRLFRMRVVKRFLDALKAEKFSQDVFPFFMESLKSLVMCNMTAEVFRSLALFVTYAYHKPTNQHTRNGSRRPSIGTLSDTKELKSTFLTRRQCGTKILEMYSSLLCQEDNITAIRKFARTVTNKWLLHLLTEDDAEVIILATKILSRLLVVHGSSYISKFTNKTGGFTIMRHRLRRWWSLPRLWSLCFSILFNRDVAEIDIDRPFGLFYLWETFSHCKVINSQVLPVITSMIQYGLKEVLRNQDDPDSPLTPLKEEAKQTSFSKTSNRSSSRNNSISTTKNTEPELVEKLGRDQPDNQATLLYNVARFFADLHCKSSEFRDFALSSEYLRLLLAVLFPVVVSTDAMSAETELNSRETSLTFGGNDVIIRPVPRLSPVPASSMKVLPRESSLSPATNYSRPKTLRNSSSFILMTTRPSEFSPSSARLTLVPSPRKKMGIQQATNSLIEDLLELIIAVFIDRVMVRKEFSGFGLFSKSPPGFHEHQVYFQTYILRNTISQLSNSIQLNQKILWEPRVIQNMARFVAHTCEAVFEGWFLSGAEPLIDFAGTVLEYLQRPEISKIKSVRLCHQAILNIKNIFIKVVLLRFSEIDGYHIAESDAVAFMDKIFYWQAILLSPDIGRQDEYFRLVCYQLYLKLTDSRESIRFAAANLWRIMLVQKPKEISFVFQSTASSDHQTLINDFKRLIELDNETFLEWIDQQRTDLDAFFFGAITKTWERFVNSENEKTLETNRARILRRRERLKQWHTEELNEEDILLRHDLGTAIWMKNIYTSEHLKHQRAQQDQQDNFIFLASTFSNMAQGVQRPCAVFYNGQPLMWQLDRTEGRNRMRMRILPNRDIPAYDYRPKRNVADVCSHSEVKPRVSTSRSTSMTPSSISAVTITINGNDEPSNAFISLEAGLKNKLDGGVTPDDDFELVDDPNDPVEDETYEDKNRKVMRSLQRGDQVLNVFNVSRIIGLEACEGLCIIGKDCLYLIDNVFQRSDGEIVNVMQAPKEERDPYLQMISGKNDSKDITPNNFQTQRADQTARSWSWNDLISISKRRFLFRDVAVEVFFIDGRSYLLTAISPLLRDDLHAKLTSKAPHTCGNSTLPNPEDGWRLEALKAAEEAPTSLSYKFGNIFSPSASNPAMRKWVKGEISNFHYLMLVNTMAGRTFNDLTQYPIFPWVISDYKSAELDLNDPSSFRDLSKPMGAQHSSRAAEFVERYKQFAEMGDHNTPAFHYGTHYSSAMIVTSYLIRLQPFVQSYLLLQGGSFDHPDRLFYSIEKAWLSASRDNMTDVRELTPEFFYLPEFLTNSNGFDFGTRQGKGGTINTVELPPWAKGDPKIFIAKNREALESPYVSQYLHHWIDLIFGSKQRGEAAIDSINVFHYLSYHGAKDLETITDPMQKLATIGIIHNFGQTPHQVFTKPHQSRENFRHKQKRLDNSAHTLTRLPFPILETHERVTSLNYLPKLDRLLCGTNFRLNIPPHYDKYLEYGFADGSLRFFFVDSKKPAGLFENIHQGQISSAIFASSTLLITSGKDCVVSAHTVITSQNRAVDLQPRTSLFGHKAPVTVLAVSKSFSTLLTASVDGIVILWDLNRLEFVRKLTSVQGSVECACINDVTGNIMICREQTVVIYTLNGDLILEQNLSSGLDDYISSCAWFEGTGNEWIENDLCFISQRGGIVNCWKKTVTQNPFRWGLELVKKMEHYPDGNRCIETAVGGLDLPKHGRNTSQSFRSGSNDIAITCIMPMAQTVYTGDEEGKVYQWDLVPREH